MDFDRFKAVARSEGVLLEDALDVSNDAPMPYRMLSPFTYSPDFRIPVPGQEERYACSVESIWQGLKIIDGTTDFKLFERKPVKRRGDTAGHLFNNRSIGLIEAREEIYYPAYDFYLKEYVSQQLKEELLGDGLDKEVLLYDVEENINFNDTSSPLAHSFFAAKYLNALFSERTEETLNNLIKIYNANKEESETLAEPLSRALEFYSDSKNFDRKFMRFVLNQLKTEDKYMQRFYERMLREINARRNPRNLF